MLSVLQMTIDADMNEQDIEHIAEHMNPFGTLLLTMSWFPMLLLRCR